MRKFCIQAYRISNQINKVNRDPNVLQKKGSSGLLQVSHSGQLKYMVEIKFHKK
jgi:hypothetical protein